MIRFCKIILNAWLLVVCVLSFTTCKKYPEDENIQLRTVRKRISLPWKLNKLIVDGVDSTEILLSFFKISSPGYLVLDCVKPKIGQNDNKFGVFVNGEWRGDCYFKFIDDKNKLFLTSTRALFYSSNAEWNIKKLSMKAFVFEGNYKNKSYRYEFKY